jgi:hypothetical protein
LAKALHADSTGSVANNYLYQGEDILAEYANGWAAATGFITHGATTDVPLAWQPAANDPVGSRYFHQDGLGSIVAMSTTSGTTDTERFDAWGAKLIGSGAIPLYGYTGREQDGTPATGTGFYGSGGVDYGSRFSSGYVRLVRAGQ